MKAKNMLYSTMKNASLLLLMLFQISLIAQDISISYQNPVDLFVCKSAPLSVTLTNTADSVINDIDLNINFPIGVQYDLASVVNATQENITDLSNPIFNIASLQSGESITIDLSVNARCSLVDEINTGVLFNNNISVDYPGGSNGLTTIFYDIETPRLVITEFTPSVLSGTQGDVLTRTITVQNTRLGPLCNFTLHDSNTGGVVITSSSGVDISPNNFNFITELGASDFMLIGDGDELFEIDETITITENILITDCGVGVPVSNSSITAQWGCNMEVCQETDPPFFGVLNIGLSTLAPNLTFETSSEEPQCFCADESNLQSMTFTNDGVEAASNINILIEQEFSTGIIPNSFTIDSAGVSLNVNPIYGGVDSLDCDVGEMTHQSALLLFSNLEVGESITISWQVYYCTPGCFKSSFWSYDYGYYKSCPPNQFIGATDIIVPIGILGTFSAIDSESEDLAFSDGEIVPFTYTLNAGQLSTSDDQLALNFEVDCGYSVTSMDGFSLGGNIPTSTEIVPTDTTTEYTIIYDLPFTNNEVVMDFEIGFDCANFCETFDTCYTELLTSCTDLCPGGPVFAAFLNIVASITSEECSGTDCGYNECLSTLLFFEPCEEIEVCYDTIPGYADFDYKISRVNYGTRDDNNDRIQDSNQPADTELISLNRAIAGDTMQVNINSEVVVEFDGFTFERARIEQNFRTGSLANQAIVGGNGLDFLYTEVSIYDESSGLYYNCNDIELGPLDFANFAFEFTPEVFTTNCGLPSGFLLAQGDSILIESQFRILHNPIRSDPEAQFPPSITVNARPGLYLYNDPDIMREDLFSCSCGGGSFSVSGYEYKFGIGSYPIPPCDTSSYSGLNSFVFQLAEGNYFPFEFRNFANLLDMQLTIPPLVTPVESKVNSLLLQQGALLNSSQIIVPASSTGNTYVFDLEAYYDQPIDEGFSYSFQHIFVSDCSFSSYGAITVGGQIAFFDPLLEEGLVDTSLSTNSVRALIPNLNLSTIFPNTISYDDEAIWELELLNTPTNVASSQSGSAPNCWLYPFSPLGEITDFQILLADGTVLNPVNGIFQLGDIDMLSPFEFELIGINSSCNQSLLEVQYGWDCDPLTTTVTNACYSKTLNLSATSPPAELEMEPESPQGVFDLCGTVDYHEVEVLNADLGAAFFLNIEALLPQGLSVIPGSSQMAYPSGSGWQNIGDPVDVGNNTVVWDVPANNADIADHGLSGINSAPENKVTIRFQSTTSCDFIAGSYIIFTTTAEQNCLLPTNTISKAGLSIDVTNLSAPYTTNINVLPDNSIACDDEITYTVNITPSEMTNSDDSIFINLPEGISYSTSSYIPLSNAPATGPIVNQQSLKWAMGSVVNPDELISFKISIFGFSDLDCGQKLFFVQTVAQGNALCVATGQSCSVLVETGSVFDNIDIERPIYDITSFSIEVPPTGGVVDYAISVSNENYNTIPPTIVDIYYDTNSDGMFSPGDQLLHTDQTNTVIGNNGNFTFAGSFDFNNQDYCQLIAVIDPQKHCACETDEQIVLNPIEFIYEQGTTICSGGSTMIGIQGSSNSTYSWQPNNNLNCSSCPMAEFTFTNINQNDAELEYILVEETAGGCLLNHIFNVTIRPELGINNVENSICNGSFVELVATAGSSYDWFGPGITNSSEQIQLVSPSDTATYYVTLTDQFGCVGADSVTINVLQSPELVVNDTVFCAEGLTQLEVLFVTGYNYQWEDDPLDPQLSNPSIHNPVILNNEPATYNLVVTNSNGCSLTYDVAVDFSTPPPLTISDEEATVCSGTLLTFTAGGANSYEWSPAGIVDCVTCPVVNITPEESVLLTVTGYDVVGCPATASINVVVAETITTSESLSTCQGDAVVIFGEEELLPGQYCQTFDGVNGCDSTHCVNLSVTDSLVVEEFDLCEGDTFEYEGNSYDESGENCFNYTSSTGCDSTYCFNLTFTPLPDEFITASADTIRPEETVVLTVSEGYTYEWDSGDTLSCYDCNAPVATLNMTTNFSVTITDGNGCQQVLSTIVFLNTSCNPKDVEIPNIFTPNGDGLNDTFGAVIIDGLEDVELMEVWNRWGKLVFEGTGKAARWDGMVDGEPAPSDVYLYKIIVTCSGNDDEIMIGDITLMR